MFNYVTLVSDRNSGGAYMESPKIKVLGIAPYEAMKNVMEKLARKRPQMEMDVYVGDLKKGVDIAQKNIQGNYDVIISRGGTAEMIGKVTHIPVIEISLSVYDILRAMKLAENYSDKYAVVGFPSITSSAHLLCDLLQYKIDIVTIHNENEVESTLRDLKKNGCRMILCDMIANTTAKKLGLNSILITSATKASRMHLTRHTSSASAMPISKRKIPFWAKSSAGKFLYVCV